MKRFALLVLQHNANSVIHEVYASHVKEAARLFNETVKLSDGQGGELPLGLDEHGYRKGDPQLGDAVTYCVTEYLGT